jgi:hypothetical protein
VLTGVRVRSDVDALAATTLERFGRVHIYVTTRGCGSDSLLCGNFTSSTGSG